MYRAQKSPTPLKLKDTLPLMREVARANRPEAASPKATSTSNKVKPLPDIAKRWKELPNLSKKERVEVDVAVRRLLDWLKKHH